RDCQGSENPVAPMKLLHARSDDVMIHLCQQCVDDSDSSLLPLAHDTARGALALEAIKNGFEPHQSRRVESLPSQRQTKNHRIQDDQISDVTEIDFSSKIKI